jgi:hypothetical protein
VVRHIVEAVEHHTARKEGPVDGDPAAEGLAEEHRSRNAAAVEPHMTDNRPEEGMGCDSAEDNALVEDMDCFRGVLQEHYHHNRHSRPEVVGIVHPEEDKGCCFEGGILEVGGTGLEQACIGLGIGPEEGIADCTSRYLISGLSCKVNRALVGVP